MSTGFERVKFLSAKYSDWFWPTPSNDLGIIFRQFWYDITHVYSCSHEFPTKRRNVQHVGRETHRDSGSSSSGSASDRIASSWLRERFAAGGEILRYRLDLPLLAGLFFDVERRTASLAGWKQTAASRTRDEKEAGSEGGEETLWCLV